jgi:hypothetical protein
VFDGKIKISSKKHSGRDMQKIIGLAFWILPATTLTFMKDTVLSENGRGAAGYE